MNWTKSEDSKGVLTIQLEGEEWQNAVKKAFNKAKAGLNIKGFRKGQVPASVAKKMISMDAVYDNAAYSLAQEAYTKGIDEFGLDPVTQPVLHIEDANEEGCTLKFEMIVSPDVTVNGWQEIKVPEEAVEVTEDQVKNEIAKLQDKYADWVDKEEDQAAADGDETIIDFVGKKDGAAFEGGTGSDYPLVLGSGAFIPGFEEQLVGMKPGEEKTIDVTFPENYPAEDLAGQPVQFDVTVKEVRSRELPEADDAFAEMVTEYEDAKTVQELEAAIRASLEKEAKEQAEEKRDAQIIDELIAKTEVNIPEAMIDAEIKRMVDNNEARFKQMGFTLDQYLAANGMTREQLMEEMKPQAEKNIKQSLALEQVAVDAGLEVTDEELEQEYEMLHGLYNLPVERLKEIIDPSQVIFNKKQEKAMDLLRKNA